MNYLHWNKLIGNYFFNEKNNGREISLFIRKEDIINLYKVSKHFNEKIIQVEVNNNSERSVDSKLADHEIDDWIWKDFTNALSCSYQDSINNTFYTKIDALIDLWREKKDKTVNGVKLNIPPWIAYLTSYIIPLSDNEDEFNHKTYYKKVINYFAQNRIFNGLDRANYQKDPSKFNSDFESNFRRTDFIWEELSKWSKVEMSGTLGIYTTKIAGSFEYVGKPFAECLIFKYQKDQIPLLFSRGDLSPGQEVLDEEFIDLLKENGESILKYKPNKWQQIINDSELFSILLKIIKDEYSKWLGQGLIFDEKEKKYVSEKKTFSIYLTFSMNLSLAALGEFKFRFYNNDNDEVLESYNFSVNENNLISPQFYPFGWSKASFRLPFSVDRFLIEKTIYLDNENNLKAVFLPKNLYLFSKESGIEGYFNKNKIEKTGSYFLLFKAGSDKILEWIKTCGFSKELSHFSGIPAGWQLYQFSNPTISCLGFSELMLSNDIKCTVDGLRIEGSVYHSLYPIKLFFTGLNQNDKVFAKVVQNKKEIELHYVDNENCFFVNSSDIMEGEKFQIFVNDHCILQSNFSFTNSLIGSDYYESSRNALGTYSENGKFKGLSIIDYNIKFQAFEINLYNYALGPNKPQKQKVIGEYLFQDNLLYSLSVSPVFERSFFTKAFGLTFEMEGKLNYSSYLVKNSIKLYDQLGFINDDYDITSKSKKVTLNRPTLISLPGELFSEYYQVLLTGARTVKFMQDLIEYCNISDHFTIDFSIKHPDNLHLKYILPQPVRIYSRSKRKFSELAKDLEIYYQEDLFYSVNLIKEASGIDNFEENIQDFYNKDFDDYETEKQYFNLLDENILKINSREIINKKLNIVEYNPGSYLSRNIFWKNGLAYELDKSWGRLLFLKLINRNDVIQYDENTQLLIIPSDFKLPKIYARAFSLLTGLAPMERYNEKRKNFDYIYQVPSHLAYNSIFDKLKQYSHKTNYGKAPIKSS